MNYFRALIEIYSMAEWAMILFCIMALIVFLAIKTYNAGKVKKWKRNGSAANRHDKDCLMATIKHYYGKKGAR